MEESFNSSAILEKLKGSSNKRANLESSDDETSGLHKVKKRRSNEWDELKISKPKLFEAISSNNISLILQEAKLDLGVKDRVRFIQTSNRNGFLHYAIEADASTVICNTLINSFSLDVNKENSDKETPMHFAVRKNRLDLVKSLEKQGAKVVSKDPNIFSPYRLLKQLLSQSQGNFSEILQFFRSKGYETEVVSGTEEELPSTQETAENSQPVNATEDPKNISSRIIQNDSANNPSGEEKDPYNISPYITI